MSRNLILIGKREKPTSPGLLRNIYVVAMMQICIGKQQK